MKKSPRFAHPFPDSVDGMIKALDIRCLQSQAQALTLGFAWKSQLSNLGHLKIRNTNAMARKLIEYISDRSIQLYFDTYGRVHGHLAWRHRHNAGTAPQVEIDSVAMTPRVRRCVLQDVRNLSAVYGADVTYTRVQRTRLVRHVCRQTPSYVENDPFIAAFNRINLPPILENIRISMLVGEILQLFANSSLSASEDPYRRIATPISCAQHEIAYGAGGEAVGLVTWAWTSARFRDPWSDIASVHNTRWRCGPELVLIDGVGDWQAARAAAVSSNKLSAEETCSLVPLHRF